MNIILLFLLGFASLASEPVLVKPDSIEETQISSFLVAALTTQTGCEITGHLFLHKSDFLKRFFGLTTNDAQLITERCPKSLKTLSSIFYRTPTARPEKRYLIHPQDPQGLIEGWTNADNQTHLFLSNINDPRTLRILVHEMMVTMDDKFHLAVKDFAKLGFNLDLPASGVCSIDRFLQNPYFQVTLSSLRAFWMELKFAQDLKDETWFTELRQYGLLDLRAAQSFELFVAKTPNLIQTAFLSQQDYFDPCEQSRKSIQDLSPEEILSLTQRDFAAVKSIFQSPQDLEKFFHFLTRQVSISALDSNMINSGPRPAVTPGGWSTQLEDRKIPLELRQHLLPKLQFQSTDDWKKAQLERVESLKRKKNLSVLLK